MIKLGPLRLESLGLVVPLLVGAFLYLWRIEEVGWGNQYYAAAVAGMTQNLHSFFFNSYDAGGFVTVDKPPLALWIQAASALLFGLNGFSLILPQIVAGLASIALIYFLVRRAFGPVAGGFAALALAIMPITVAVVRTNNLDPIMVLALLLAAWAFTLATERARLGLLVLGMALAGLAFNVKMLAAFVPLPVFYALYFFGAPTSWARRVAHLALGTIVLAVVSLSWATIVDLTPTSERPYIGGSTRNSVYDLILNYNGLGRITGNEGPGPGMGRAQLPAPAPGTVPGGTGPVPNVPRPGGDGGQVVPRGGGAGPMDGGAAGPFRLLTQEMAGQSGWFYPVIVVGGVAALLQLGRRWWARPARRRAVALGLWGGWLLIHFVLFSFAEGIFHTYYLSALAPGAAALVGIGLHALVRAYRKGGWGAWLLPLGVAATLGWAIYILAGWPDWNGWLAPLVATLGVVALACLVLLLILRPRLLDGARLRFAGAAIATAVALATSTLVIAPAAWAATPIDASANNALPQAGPGARLDAGSGGQRPQARPNDGVGAGRGASGKLINYLEANYGGERYFLAVPSTMTASPIILETGRAVMAMGGFNGSDPILTPEKISTLVARKEVRFVLASGLAGPGMGGPGAAGDNSAAMKWVRSYCTEVERSLWQDGAANEIGGMFLPMPPNGPGGPGGSALPPNGDGPMNAANNLTLYDCASR